ncbi:MAG: 5-formyltetrahydrofolate cyclo-ligase [Lachnospiraceae bacterium]|nr:5-formyltetrahydrofolate cyclo-ligase [Lachnospiraceae bacterium]
MGIKEEKQMIRKIVSQKLSSYSKEWITRESSMIQNHVIKSREYKEAETIFCYVSFGKEVETYEILKDALKKGKKVGVPLCIQKGVMEVRNIHSMDDLQPGAYGILEPKKETEVMKKEELTYGIIPCVTCDKYGNRMGHGAGYYDRYLSGTKMIKAIVCFEEIMEKNVPVTSLDITMDQVISQKGILHIKNPV